MTTRSVLHGLYAITPTRLTDIEQLSRQVTQALAGGVRILQYRDKTAETRRREAIARRLRDLTHTYQALLLINDDVELARTVEADGVHLGREDTSLSHARDRLGSTAIIGISCYNRFELAQSAANAGADYVAFGSFFPSRTKPEAVQARPELLQRAHRELPLPVAAIGGITAENGGALIAAGASMLAVVEAVFGAEDIGQAARRLAAHFSDDDKPISD